MWFRYLLVPIGIILLADHGEAGIFGKTKPKTDPEKHVPALLAILKSDKDEGKRAEAAAELREYDPKVFVDLIPGLIEALQNDPSSSVRTEAVNSLGKIRPVNQRAGYALEQALANDESVRVRLAARTTLWQYHLLGYRSGKPLDKSLDQTAEPPLAQPNPKKIETPKTPLAKDPVSLPAKATNPPATPHPLVSPRPPLIPAPAPKQGPIPTTVTKTNSGIPQTVEPPLAIVQPKAAVPVRPPVTEPKSTPAAAPAVPARMIDPKLNTPPILPPAFVPPNVIEPLPKIDSPTVPSLKLPSTPTKAQDDGPILTPPKN